MRWLAIKLQNPIANPLLMSILVIIPILLGLDTSYDTYYAQNDWMTYLLQPSVVALAYPLYQQWPQVKANWHIILPACAVGSALSMFTAGTIAALLHANPQLIASLMGKSVTTPIAMEVASHLGGEAAIAAILVLIVGVFGAICAYPLFNRLKITHPIARGLTMGTVSHALGTATCADKNPQDAAFSSLALVVCGIFTSILAPFMYAYCIWLQHFLN